jgi:hypothetical protein
MTEYDHRRRFVEILRGAGEHRNFAASVSCVECGWKWDGWIEDAADAVTDHMTEAAS